MRHKSLEKQIQPNLMKSNILRSKVLVAKDIHQTELKKNSSDMENLQNSELSAVFREKNDTKSVMIKPSDVAMDKSFFNENITIINSIGHKKINCRLCDKDITGKECQLLYDEEEKVETRLGRKINIIINSTETQSNLSQYCCSVCTSKIEICFSLLVEIQASDEVIKQTYEHLSNGVSVDTSTQVFICGECKSIIKGIKSFIRHYENHILKKTVINSKRDLKVSQLVPYYTNDEQKPLHNEAECIAVDLKLNVMEGDCIMKEDPVCETETNDNDKVRHEEKIGRNFKIKKNDHGKLLDCEFNVSSDEFYEKNTDIEDHDLDADLLTSDNEFNISPDSDHENDPDIAHSIDKEADLDDISETNSSVSSDTSYQKLVEIVKKELEKSDSDEDPNMELTVNEDGNYYCSTCNQAFDYKFLLVHHLMKNHKWPGLADESGSEAIKIELDEDNCVHCPQCQELILSSEIEKHLSECAGQITESGDILCHSCGKLYTYKQWATHKKKHMSHAAMWSCELCGKRFKAKRILRSHLGEHDESKKKVCEICGKKLLPLSFFSHMMKHKEKRHVCQFCGKGFTYNYGLRMHLKVHEGSERIESKPGKKRDKVFCWLCKKDFDSSSALHKHLKNEHNTEGVEQDSRFSCSECDKKFADMFGLKAHLKLIHEMKDEEISRFKSLPVYRYIECNVCNQVFNSENKVRIHMKQDHGLKPFEMEILKKECEKCGKRFASKQNLIHHINGAHLNIKPMQCDICNERFAKHSSLIYHKLRHSGEKPFQCEFCQKTYRQRNDVIRHLARHVRDQELTLEEASAINNSPSPLVLKRRIFLKDSSISYQALVNRNRRQKAEIVEVDPMPVAETKIEYDEGSLIYVEEVMADEIQQPESPTEIKYMTVKPVYNEERNTIILSSPELFKNAVENMSYRYVTPQLKDIPAVIVKKETDM